MKQNYDNIIIGGGAAGLFAAVTAAQAAPGSRVAVVERESRVGKKLLTTGNGRCNLTNASGLHHRYYGDTDFAMAAFDRFGVKDTCRIMHRLGIDPVVLEEGKVFPRSLQAGSVVDMLRFAAADAGVTVMTDTTVLALSAEQAFRVVTDQGDWTASKVLIATGGKAAVGKYNGPTGYDLLKGLGHSVTGLTPAIVQITTEKEPIKPLAGIKIQGRVTAEAGGENRWESGEILFAEYGLSGPPVLQVSGLIARHGGGSLCLDVMPDVTEQELIREIESRCAAFSRRPCEELFTGFCNKRLGQTVIKRAGVPKLSLPCGSLKPQEIRRIAHTLKAFTLQATGTKGWNAAQVTCGGVNTREFCGATMESKLHPGLYAAGEVMNVTGDCGGFNLQWAWTSGYLAGRAMAGEDVT